MILLYIYKYIYKEKKKVYNIEGQLRDFQDPASQKLAHSKIVECQRKCNVPNTDLYCKSANLQQSCDLSASPREILFTKSKILAALCVIFLRTPRLKKPAGLAPFIDFLRRQGRCYAKKLRRVKSKMKRCSVSHPMP
jgi:hypothetical protein